MLLLSKDFGPKKEATLSERGRSIPLHFVPSFDCDDDFVGVLGPGKGPGVCIGVIEEAVDGLFEFLERAERAWSVSPVMRLKLQREVGITFAARQDRLPRRLGRRTQQQ